MRGWNGGGIGSDALDAGVDHLVMDGARGGGTGDAGGWIGLEVGTGWDLEAEGGDGDNRRGSAGSLLAGGLGGGLVADDDREIALDGVEHERGLVAVLVDAPGEDADLVEVEGESGGQRGGDGEVFRGLVVGEVGVRIGDLGEHPGADEALTFSVLGDVVGDVDVKAVAEQPAGVSSGVAG